MYSQIHQISIIVSKKKRKKFVVQNLGGFDSPYEVAYYDKNGKELKRSWYRQDSEFAEYDKPYSCDYAVIDPDKMMPDVVRTNNSSKDFLN